MAKMQNAAHTNIEEEEEEKWVKHYSSLHEILLVGEGDFSFSTCLAKSFGSASNIVATSLDTYDDVIKNYKRAKSNFSILDNLGALRLHGVDATTMKFHTDLKMRKFDRIIFNFPHAGFHRKDERDIKLIRMHKKLLNGFFKNASGMLRQNGEIHVNHKTTNPYSNWNLEELASQNSLGLIERVNFNKEDYPGYENKRGSGKRCDGVFHLGKCCTFKFRFSRDAKQTKVKQKVKRLPNLAKSPMSVSQQPNHFNRHPSSYPATLMGGITAMNYLRGSTCELRHAPMHATRDENYFQYRQVFQAPVPIYTTQRGNYIDYRQPCVSLQAPAPIYICTARQGNYIDYRQPRENLQAPSGGAYPQGHYLSYRQPRKLLPAPVTASQEWSLLLSESSPSRYTQHISSIPYRMVSPHIDDVDMECSRIFGVHLERVVKALQSFEHNPYYVVEEEFDFCYEIFKAAMPGRTWGDFTYILDRLRICLFKRQELQVTDLAYYGRRDLLCDQVD